VFTFHDSVPRAVPDNQPVSSEESATPIFDRLIEEWQRMFRAVPGDRFGEGVPPSGTQPAYPPVGYGYAVPAQQSGGTASYDTFGGRSRQGRSGLALMPVTGQQPRHLPL
jgi:hypothetical protein